MKAVKILVIVMGVMIVAGMGLLVYGMARQFDRIREAADPVPLGAVDGTLPAGWRAVETAVGDGRIVVLADGPDGAQALFLYDSDLGRPMGQIKLAE